MGDAAAALMVDAVSVVREALPSVSLPPGVFTYESLRAQASVAQPYLVDGLVPARSLGMFVGNPGIGKTPFAMQMGLSIAAGIPFLGRATTKGSVLYCIGEGTSEDFVGLQDRLARALGLPSIPDEFRIFAPYWTTDEVHATIDAVKSAVADLRPKFVIVDTMRVFAPGMEEKAARVSPMLNELKGSIREHGSSWTLIHHLRKRSHDFPADLEADPLTWFDEAAGSNALITSTDFRLGVAMPSYAGRHELVFGGFVRGRGALPTSYLVREYDADDVPQAYQLVGRMAALSRRQEEVYVWLPETFTFKDVKARLGGASSSNADNYVKAYLAAGLVAQPDPRGPYRKLVDSPRIVL